MMSDINESKGSHNTGMGDHKAQSVSYPLIQVLILVIYFNRKQRYMEVGYQLIRGSLKMSMKKE